MNLIRTSLSALLVGLSASALAHAPILDLDRGPAAFLPGGLAEPRPTEWLIDVGARADATWRRTLGAGEGCVLVLDNPRNEPAEVTVVISQDDAGHAMPGTRPVSLRVPGHGRHALTLQASRSLSVSVYTEK